MIIPFNNRLYDYFFKNYSYLLSKAPFPPLFRVWSLIFSKERLLNGEECRLIFSNSGWQETSFYILKFLLEWILHFFCFIPPSLGGKCNFNTLKLVNWAYQWLPLFLIYVQMLHSTGDKLICNNLSVIIFCRIRSIRSNP